MKSRPTRGAIRRAVAAVVLALTAVPGEAATNDSYGDELAQVYGTYQAIVARREACDEAVPATRTSIARSYTAWRTRHAKLIAELDDRLAALIRGASKDDKEYARNIGKYEGAMLQQRQEAKQTLLAQPHADLQTLCRALPALLDSRASDLETVYAEELKSIRSRR
jgi:hypothetical protein